MIRILYRISCVVALPFALLRLVWRARAQPAYLKHLGERFGSGKNQSNDRPIWIHAVSVGETRAAEPLVRAIRDRHPGVPILLTCTTPTGRATAAQLFGSQVRQAYIPYDLPFAVRRFLARNHPRIALLMETELWPEMIFDCRQRQIPVHVVNARLSARSAQRYGRVTTFIAQVLECVHSVAAQSDADAQRFRQLGAANVQVCGNLKFDRGATSTDLALGESFRRQFNGRRAILAASTRAGEEELLLQAWAQLQRTDLLLVLVPRHPQRFEEVAQQVTQQGLTLQRRSANAPLDAAAAVWLGDSMGEMYAYHAACDASVIGGSFLELGGQNLLEACAVGRPVIVGPHMFNFAEATRLALNAGAALQVSNAALALSAATALVDDEPRARLMGEKGLALMAQHQGATRRVLELLNL